MHISSPGVAILCRFLVICTLAVAACTSEQAPESASPQISGDGDYSLKNERFTVDLQIPTSGSDLARKEMLSFLQAHVDGLHEITREAPEPGYFETHRYTLTSRWERAESDSIYTFIVRGNIYTGGAHGNPFLRTFSYAKEDDTAIDLDSLLRDSNSLAEISERAEAYFSRHLGERLDADGLSAEADNWRQWFVSDSSITFLFPQYQIASYADGEQRFTLSVDADTQHLVDPTFFGIDEAAADRR